MYKFLPESPLQSDESLTKGEMICHQLLQRIGSRKRDFNVVYLSKSNCAHHPTLHPFLGVTVVPVKA